MHIFNIKQSGMVHLAILVPNENVSINMVLIILNYGWNSFWALKGYHGDGM